MRYILLILPLLAACGGGGGGGSTPAVAPPIYSATFSADAPTDLYYNQHGSILVTVTNTGTENIYEPISVKMDGYQMTGISVPSMSPGEQYVGSYAIWAAQSTAADHTFQLSAPSGWTQTLTIHYHGIING